MKACHRCSRPAQYSLVVIVSTLGVSPRLQGCSAAILLCADCALTLHDTERCSASELHGAVNSAFTKLDQRRTSANKDDARRVTA